MLFEFKDYTLDDSHGVLLRNGRRVKIEPNALSMLAHLLRHHHRVVSKEELIKVIWGGASISASSLPRCMSALRSSLSSSVKDGSGNIRTVYGLGYQFVAPVRKIDATKTIGQSCFETRSARSRQISDLLCKIDQPTTPSQEKPKLGLEQGILETRQGLFSSARRTLLRAASLAREANEVEILAQATIALASTYLAIHRNDSIIELLKESIKAVGLTNPRLSLELKAAGAVANITTTAHTDRRSEVQNLTSDAIKLDDPQTTIRVLALGHRVIEGPGTTLVRRAMSAKAVAETSKLPSTRLELEARYRVISDCLISADIEGLESNFSLCVDLARNLDENIWFARIGLTQAMLAFLRGRYDEAIESRMRALEFIKDSPEDYRMMDCAHGWMVCRERPEEIVRQRLPILGDDSHLDRLAEISVALGMCYMGHREQAVKLIERMPRNWIDTEARNHIWSTVVAFCAELAFLVDDRSLAVRILAEIPSDSQSMVSMDTSICAEPVDYFRGLALTTAKSWEHAEKCFAHAFELSRSLCAFGFQARIAYAWGHMLFRQRARRRLSLAHDKAAYALRIAERLGMSRLRGESALLLTQTTKGMDSPLLNASST